jgi:SAM-dependent methyltransferase
VQLIPATKPQDGLDIEPEVASMRYDEPVRERMVPGNNGALEFREHQSRYQFAGRYVAGKTVLDAASGPGTGTEYLVRAGAKQCIGIDIDEASVCAARRLYPSAEFRKGSVLEMPFENESFDVVVSFETIEHIVEQERFLDECVRVLRRGGIFVCSTPHHQVSKWILGDNPFHLRELHIHEFASMLQKRFSTMDLFAQELLNYPEMLFKQIGVRILSVLHLKEAALRSLGKLYLEVETATTFSPPAEGDPILLPYRASWLRQPAVVVAVCRL